MPPTADEVRVQLGRLLASDGFAGAERLSRFLRYVVERSLAGEGDQLKEYVVGLEVFDRDHRYDPRVDSIVRVEAGRLRAKVDAYYSQQGRDDPVIIRVPRGGYAPEFERRRSSVALPDPEKPHFRPFIAVTRWRVGLSALAAALALVAVAAWRAGLWTTGEPRAPVVTMAVLPFAHYSSSEAEQLLAARVTDGVTGELARVDALGVVSRTSAHQFGAGSGSLRDIARALGADVVLEASLIAEGDQIRVEARLVDGALDRKVWVESFAASATDVDELVRRIAAAVTSAALARGR